MRPIGKNNPMDVDLHEFLFIGTLRTFNSRGDFRYIYGFMKDNKMFSVCRRKMNFNN